MEIYVLFSNGRFVVAKPLFNKPTSPMDFGVAELSTSVYDIFRLDHNSQWTRLEPVLSIPATLDVG